MAIASANSYHTESKLFAGPTYKSLLVAGIQASISGWLTPTAGKPAGWIDITTYTYFDGTFAQRLTESTIIWEATLSGENYNDAYLALGLALCLWTRYWTPGDGWLPWHIEFIGEIVAANNKDNYQHGKEWQRNVVSSFHVLSRINAPPLSAGLIDCVTGAAVDVKDNDILPDPQLELDSSEFTGAVLSVRKRRSVSD